MTGKNKDRRAEEIARELAEILPSKVIYGMADQIYYFMSGTTCVAIKESEPNEVQIAFGLHCGCVTLPPDLARRVLETIRDFEKEKK